MFIQQSDNVKHGHELALWLRRLALLGFLYLFFDGMTRLALPLILAFPG